MAEQSAPEVRNPFGWVEIYVSDMVRAKAFYETVFGFTLERLGAPEGSPGPQMEMWSFPMNMQVYGASGALVKMEGVQPGGGGTLVYFSCSDCVVELARAKAAGARVQTEKTSIGQYGHIAIFIDTEGNCIGLHSM